MCIRDSTYTGELYFSAHRGTYTSQAMVKQNNRRCELSMRELELWSTLAALKGKAYPAEAVERLWKEVLLHQFHDILPGSSIARVYQEAEKAFHAILDESHELTEEALQSLTEGENGITVDVYKRQVLAVVLRSVSAVRWTALKSWQ